MQVDFKFCLTNVSLKSTEELIANIETSKCHNRSFKVFMSNFVMAILVKS